MTTFTPAVEAALEKASQDRNRQAHYAEIFGPESEAMSIVMGAETREIATDATIQRIRASQASS